MFIRLNLNPYGQDTGDCVIRDARNEHEREEIRQLMSKLYR